MASEYIHHLLSNEEYSFSLDELRNNSIKSDAAIKSELSRLVLKGEILNLRKGFYLIIPPRYSKLQHLPVQLYAQKLFKSLDRKYYLAFYSASKFHGASHQQIHQEYIITEGSKLTDMTKGKLNIRFFTSSKWPEKNISTQKSDAGIFQISSPALTCVDLIHYHSKLGGINRISSVLNELTGQVGRKDIIDLLSWYPYLSTLQRLGYFFEYFSADQNLTEAIYLRLRKDKFFPVTLSRNSNKGGGKIDNKWKVDANVRLEIES